MDRTGTATRKFFTTEISEHIVEQSSSSCVGRRCHRRRSNRTPQGSGPVLVSNVPHNGTQSLVLHCFVLDLDDHQECHCFCTGENLPFSLLLTSQHSLVLVTLVHTPSDVLDGFLVSCVQILGALREPFSVRFVSPPRTPCSSARLLVLGALCCFLQRHIPHNLMCGDPPSVSWFEHPTERYDSRDRLLWLCGPCLADHGLLRPSLLQSYLSAHLH